LPKKFHGKRFAPNVMVSPNACTVYPAANAGGGGLPAAPIVMCVALDFVTGGDALSVIVGNSANDDTSVVGVPVIRPEPVLSDSPGGKLGQAQVYGGVPP